MRASAVRRLVALSCRARGASRVRTVYRTVTTETREARRTRRSRETQREFQRYRTGDKRPRPTEARSNCCGGACAVKKPAVCSRADERGVRRRTKRKPFEVFCKKLQTRNVGATSNFRRDASSVRGRVDSPGGSVAFETAPKSHDFMTA